VDIFKTVQKFEPPRFFLFFYFFFLFFSYSSLFFLFFSFIYFLFLFFSFIYFLFLFFSFIYFLFLFFLILFFYIIFFSYSFLFFVKSCITNSCFFISIILFLASLVIKSFFIKKQVTPNGVTGVNPQHEYTGINVRACVCACGSGRACEDRIRYFLKTSKF